VNDVGPADRDAGGYFFRPTGRPEAGPESSQVLDSPSATERDAVTNLYRHQTPNQTDRSHARAVR
jgi:hypothetical protein